jgi:hypothetical protein
MLNTWVIDALFLFSHCTEAGCAESPYKSNNVACSESDGTGLHIILTSAKIYCCQFTFLNGQNPF